MQGVLTSREAWCRFASTLLAQTELEPHKIGAEADQMLIEYLARFPDPPELESAKIVDDSMEFRDEAPPVLTDGEPSPDSDEGSDNG